MIEFVFQSGQNYKSIFDWKEIIFGTSAISFNWTYLYRDLVNIFWSKTLVGLCFVRKEAYFIQTQIKSSHLWEIPKSIQVTNFKTIVIIKFFYLRLISFCNSWKMLDWLNCTFHSIWLKLNDIYLSIFQFKSTFVDFLPPPPTPGWSHHRQLF